MSEANAGGVPAPDWSKVRAVVYAPPGKMPTHEERDRVAGMLRKWVSGQAPVLTVPAGWEVKLLTPELPTTYGEIHALAGVPDPFAGDSPRPIVAVAGADDADAPAVVDAKPV